MSSLRGVAHWSVLILLPLLAIGASIYFTTQAYTGRFGAIALEQVEGQRAVAERELERLSAEANAMEQRNAGLRAGSVDLDLLDERAREELGMIRPDEVFLVE